VSNGTWDWVRAHLLLAGALGCALVSTAHAEYTLATATDVNEWVALAVPGALDLYVIQALRVRRDVATAVLVMVAANVVSHLLVAGLYPRDIWWQVGVVSAVGALAPVLLWRVHSLERTRTRTELLWGVEAGAVSAPAPGAPADDECDEYGDPEAHPVEDDTEYTAPVWGPRIQWGALGPGAPAPAWVPGFHLDGCDGVHPHEGPVNCAARASALTSTAPDHVPADWSAQDAPPALALVPDLPAECAAGAVHSETDGPVLEDSDYEYLPGAQEYVDKYAKPSVRGLRRQLSIGQDRAERLLAHLGVRP
jgi:hypothetical protein